MQVQDELMQSAEDRMTKTIKLLKEEYLTLRAGRANPQILNKIVVDYYGTPTPLTQMANISSPDPRSILISLFDVNALRSVEKAIQTSDLGINPSNDGRSIRLVVPELTEERRKDLVKSVRQKGEEAKVAIRNTRRDTLDRIKKQKKDGLLTEDDQKRDEEAIQKMTDKFIKEVDQIMAVKEKEIMQV